MLESLFVSKARIKLLTTLLLEPQRRFYLRELASRTELPVRSVQVELKRLSEAGILEREVSGRQTYYQVDERCPIVPDLRSVFVKTAGLADLIRRALLPAGESINRAFIFGSFAKGEIRPDSDVDLLVVGSIKPLQLTSLLSAVEIPRAINPVVMSDDEFMERLKSRDPFLSNILQGAKIQIVGGVDDA